MPKPVIFFIHGIGEHGPNWADDAIAKLDECAKRYPSMPNKKMSQLFDLVPITYDSIITGVIDRWAVEVQALKTNALDEPVKDAVDWLDGSARGDFIWTHIADVILYMSSAVRNAVVAHVAAELAHNIKDRGLANVSYNIVAHSMGTSVAAEAVTALATPSSHPDGWQGMPSGFRFANAFMVANTSRLLQRKSVKAYTTSRLLPVKAQRGGLCTNYWNINHRYDPVPAPRSFDLQGPRIDGYLNYSLEHFYKPNVHSLVHYLEHPLLHGAIFRIAADQNLPRPSWQKVVTAYFDKSEKKFGGDFTNYDAVLNYLNRLDAFGPPNLERADAFLAQIQWIVRRLREMR